MATVIQRSITFPPIRISRIDEYVVYVAKHRPTINILREEGLEIGRGRGDITRFFERLGVVETRGEAVELTSLGKQLMTFREALGSAVYHALFYQRIPQYRILIDLIKKSGAVDQQQLYDQANLSLRQISPTAWINKVAFRTLLQIAADLRAVKKESVIYKWAADPLEEAIQNYLLKVGVKIGNNYYVSFDKVIVKECAKIEMPHNLFRVDAECTLNKIYALFSV
ncbi:MAG: hypothetical protein ABWK05_01850 [Pyrobaculum sp.]